VTVLHWHLLASVARGPRYVCRGTSFGTTQPGPAKSSDEFGTEFNRICTAIGCVGVVSGYMSARESEQAVVKHNDDERRVKQMLLLAANQCCK